MEAVPRYFDIRAEFWRRHWESAADMQSWLRDSDPEKARGWERLGMKIAPLSRDHTRRLEGFDRRLNILFLSTIWCGDCARQGPMLDRIARAAGDQVNLRVIDGEASVELRDELRILGGARVPVAVFLSEDFFEIGRTGDRLLNAYRAKARRELDASFPSLAVEPPLDELQAELEEWVDIVERMLLLLRLAPALRERYGD